MQRTMFQKIWPICGSVSEATSTSWGYRKEPMVCSERNPETTRRTKFHTRRLSPSAVAISMRPESVRLNVVARRNEARAAAAFWACVCFAALSSRPAEGLFLRIELFLRTPG